MLQNNKNLFIIKILLISIIIFFIPIRIKIFRLIYSLFLIIFVLNINNIINYNLFLNQDFISVRLIILRIWILILIIISQFNFNYLNSLYFIFFILNISLILSFRVNNLILFYFYFEWSLIPIFLIIIGWGYQLERIKSRFYLLIYTLFASLPLLIMLILIIDIVFNINITFLSKLFLLKLNNIYLLMIYLSFLVKFPMFFFHQWLPKAHVEAPVGGSIILAGILLKLGGYGIIRLLFFLEIKFLIKVFMIFSVLGGRILRIICLINRDIKVIIAYSSVVHIAFIIINLFSKSYWNLNGSIIIIIAHGICSSGIFSCANIIYERTHSRIIMINKRNLNYFPSLRIFWFILCIANFRGPFTFNLLSEILLIVNISLINFYFLIFVIFISFFSAAYRIILYSNLQQGLNNNLIFYLSNISIRELLILFCHCYILIFLLLSSTII